MIALTGSSGFIGSHVARQLLRDDIPFRLLLRNPRQVSKEFQENNIPHVQGDLLLPDTLNDFCQGATILFHVASIVKGRKPGDVSAVNVTGTKNLITVAQKQGVKKILYISSGAVDFLTGEYSESKQRAEEIIQSSPLSWIIVRPSEIYGPGDKAGITSLLPIITKWPCIPIIGDGSYHLQPLLVDDLVTSLITILNRYQSCRHKIINLAGPFSLPFVQIIDDVADNLGKKVRKIFIPKKVALFAASIISRIPFFTITNPEQIRRVLISKHWDIRQAQELLDFKPIEFKQGIARVINSMSLGANT